MLGVRSPIAHRQERFITDRGLRLHLPMSKPFTGSKTHFSGVIKAKTNNLEAPCCLDVSLLVRLRVRMLGWLPSLLQITRPMQNLRLPTLQTTSYCPFRIGISLAKLTHIPSLTECGPQSRACRSTLAGQNIYRLVAACYFQTRGMSTRDLLRLIHLHASNTGTPDPSLAALHCAYRTCK